MLCITQYLLHNSFRMKSGKHSMYAFEALRILGLKSFEGNDISAINHAWRKLVMRSHPDKNIEKSGAENAKVMTQRLNEARDTLLKPREDESKRKKREDEEERIILEKERQIKRQKQQRDEHDARCQKQYQEEVLKKKQEEEEQEARRQKLQEQQKEYEEKRRERYSRNRKKRAEGTRIHKKIDGYNERSEFIEEMQTFFKNKFVLSDTIHDLVYFSDITALFNDSRSKHTIEVEKNWFRLHTKRIFLEIFPTAICSVHKNRRCVSRIRVKE